MQTVTLLCCSLLADALPLLCLLAASPQDSVCSRSTVTFGLLPRPRFLFRVSCVSLQQLVFSVKPGGTPPRPHLPFLRACPRPAERHKGRGDERESHRLKRNAHSFVNAILILFYGSVILMDILVVASGGLHAGTLCSPSCSNCLGISVSISAGESGWARLQQ